MRSLAALVLSVSAVAASGVAPAAAQQDLARRVTGAPDGTVQLSFPARAGVCGDGRSFVADRGDGRGITYFSGDNYFSVTGTSNFEQRCVEGPVRVVLSVRDGRVVDARPYVGPAGSAQSAPRTDLGSVSGADAASALVSLARSPEERVARGLVLAANLAEGARIAGALSRLAADREAPEVARGAALRWIMAAAEREGDREADGVVRRIASDADDRVAVRDRAIRVLGESPEAGSGAFLRGLFPRLTEPSLRERVLRVVAERGDAGTREWLGQVAVDDAERTAVRERAIRLLAEETGAGRILRDLYPRLRERSLRERVVRTAGEAGDAESLRWVRGLASNASEDMTIRERAVRVLGEAGHVSWLRELYASVDDRALRDRILRIVAEAGGADNMAWVRQVASSSSEAPELRDRAVRLIAESGAPSSELATLYDRADDTSLRLRIIRLLGERRDEAAVRKLRAIATGDASEEMRRRATRALGEAAERSSGKSGER